MNETEDFIRSSIQAGGWFKEFTLGMLANTGNNRVYRLESPGGTFLVKYYFQHPDDPRDRFSTERAFYSYLWNAGIRRTPEPVHWLLKERMAVFEFVQGEKPKVATPGLVNEALDFFQELNRNRRLPDAAVLPPASEACFSVRENIDCIGQRVARLGQIKPETEIDSMAIEFVNAGIIPKWKELSNGAVRNMPDEELAADARCISPSDFGFHNSILAADGKLRFFDFEYAGWDDPARTVCDFFCQPAVPVDHSLFGGFLAKFVEMFPQPGLEERVKVLMPLYQIKWCCVMLNEFLPTSAARRRFASAGADESKRKSGQLARAEKLCSAISSN